MKQPFEETLLKSASETKLEVPASIHRVVEETLTALPEVPVRRARRFPRILSAAACLALVFLVLLPNLSGTYAAAMEKIPVLGELIRVVTVRSYLYSDGNHDLNIQVPHIDHPDDAEGIRSINREIDTLTQQLMEQFYAEVEAADGQGHGAMYVDYTVVQNTADWFTLKLSVHLLSAGGSTAFRYYHMDKTTGEVVELSDLFAAPDFAEVLTEKLRTQMLERMQSNENETYWVEAGEDGTGLTLLAEDHNFYFDKKGDLVIPFDEYEVAPGSMGTPEFTIPMEELRSLLKERYRSN